MRYSLLLLPVFLVLSACAGPMMHMNSDAGATVGDYRITSIRLEKSDEDANVTPEEFNYIKQAIDKKLVPMLRAREPKDGRPAVLVIKLVGANMTPSSAYILLAGGMSSISSRLLVLDKKTDEELGHTFVAGVVNHMGGVIGMMVDDAPENRSKEVTKAFFEQITNSLYPVKE